MHDEAPVETGTVISLFEAVPFEQSKARLARATARIEAAIIEQKEVVAAFRSTIAELREKTERLGESCQFLHQAADRINLKPLRYKSLHLARIMDSHVGETRDSLPVIGPNC